MTSPTAAKKTFREIANERRRQAAQDPEAPHAAAQNFLDAFAPAENLVFSSYWPMRDELDPRPLADQLRARGGTALLPVTVGRAQPLKFRLWTPDTLLIDGGFGTRIPPPEAAAGIPLVLIVPLLGFDGQGMRLGYGGGHYDCTLADLRQENAGTIAVGFAFAAQEFDQLPAEATDQPLDWIVTEREARKIE